MLRPAERPEAPASSASCTDVRNSRSVAVFGPPAMTMGTVQELMMSENDFGAVLAKKKELGYRHV